MYKHIVSSTLLAWSALALFFCLSSDPAVRAAGTPPAPTGDATSWIPMPLLTPQQAKNGISPGGEGAQWPRGPVAVSPAAPNFLLLPIDVGGLYRSLDGGKHWTNAMVGWDDRGANAFAIDPKNARRVIGVGSNSIDWDDHWGPSPDGLYLSTNKAGSWTHVLAAHSGVGGSVAYDPGSYNPAQGYCTLAYYLSPHEGLFRSQDGGKTWTQIGAGPVPGIQDRDWTQGGGIFARLVVDPKTRIVYIGGKGGLFQSKDHGLSFTKIWDSDVYGLALTPRGGIYVCGVGGISLSKDRGRTFMPLPCRGLDVSNKAVNGIAVSPVDPRRMLCWVSGEKFHWPRYVSRDGGNTWQPVALDSTGAPLPADDRQGYATWHPTDPNVVWSLGGDWVTRSTDGGQTFHWANNGYNGVMTGGLFNFSTTTPKTVFLGFQDYNGAFTTDGGHVWDYRDVSGRGWGGHEYGAFALNDQVMWAGDADSWGAPRHLRLTRNGGQAWDFVLGSDGKPLTFSGPDVSCGDPGDPKVGFASNFRTADGGATWQPMDGCDGVFTAGPQTQKLYGKKGDVVVRSDDHGVTWTKIADVPGGFVDLAVNDKTQVVYVASEDHLKVWNGVQWITLDTPQDQYGHSRVWTVATDPQDPNIIYVGGPMNIYASHATVCRSTDGGKTWENLTVNTPLAPGESGGPHEVGAIRVNPVTREAWVAGQCFGLWRIAPPRSSEKGTSAALASAPKAIIPPPPSTARPASGG